MANGNGNGVALWIKILLGILSLLLTVTTVFGGLIYNATQQDIGDNKESIRDTHDDIKELDTRLQVAEQSIAGRAEWQRQVIIQLQEIKAELKQIREGQ